VAHAFAHRMLFGMVVCVVVAMPFVFHWWGLGASDATGQSDDPARVMAVTLIDPYVQAANDEAYAEGRATTLSDVAAALPSSTAAGGSTAAPDPALSGVTVPAPVFTVGSDRITARMTALGEPITCVITISTGKAVESCGRTAP
jgi:hypothetical protein